MAKTFTIIIGLIIIISGPTLGQSISPKDFKKLLVTERNIYYDSLSKKALGCGQELGCAGLPITFDFIKLNKKRKNLEFGAYINPALAGRDTIGANYFRIFVARPVNKQLTAFRLIADVMNERVEKDTNATVFLQQGRCVTNFNFNKGDRLYFESLGNFYLMEYDLSPLLKKKIK